MPRKIRKSCYFLAVFFTFALLIFAGLRSLSRSNNTHEKTETAEEVRLRKAKFEALSAAWPTRNLDETSRFYYADEIPISTLIAKPKECVNNPIRYYSPTPKWGCDVMHSSGLYESVSKVVGKGGWRNVFAGEYMDKSIVLKKLNLWHFILRSTSTTSEERDMYSNFRLEASILDNLRECQNVPQLLGFCGMDVATEKIDGTLKDAVEHNADRPDSLLRALEMSLGVARGVQCLNDMKYGPMVHGDLHIGQFLVDKDGKVYINDFDRSIPLARNKVTGAPCSIERRPEDYDMLPRLSVDSRATLRKSSSEEDNPSSPDHEALDDYSLPLSVRAHPDIARFGFISEKSDIHTLGGIIYNVLSNGHPEDGSVETVQNKYGNDMVSLLSDMWSEWPELRPSASEVTSRLSALLEDFRSANEPPQL